MWPTVATGVSRPIRRWRRRRRRSPGRRCVVFAIGAPLSLQIYSTEREVGRVPQPQRHHLCTKAVSDHSVRPLRSQKPIGLWVNIRSLRHRALLYSRSSCRGAGPAMGTGRASYSKNLL